MVITPRKRSKTLAFVGLMPKKNIRFEYNVLKISYFENCSTTWLNCLNERKEL